MSIIIKIKFTFVTIYPYQSTKHRVNYMCFYKVLQIDINFNFLIDKLCVVYSKSYQFSFQPLLTDKISALRDA